jgi:hypothetical protein
MPVVATQFLRKSTSQLLTMWEQSHRLRANICNLAGGSRCFRI